MQFGEIINAQVKKFPKEERFELASQFIKASDSIALNIAKVQAALINSFIIILETHGIVLTNVFHVVQKLI